MALLPIRALTLYKQGIGYFQRRGLVEERTVSLIVPRSATNDVLKSLNIIVHEGGQILSVDYETPEDKAKVLNALSVRLADRSSLVDLLVSLRGSRVTLSLMDNTTVTGRLVGIEASLDASVQPPIVLIQADEDSRNLRVLPIGHIQELLLLDDRATRDVGFFLDVSRTEQTRTTLTLRISEGQHDLEISYLAPSPVWRMSYRLVSAGGNQATLVGWGLFDNSLGEDLEDVSLTLISGRPISFEYGLYESKIPTRPQVSDDTFASSAISGNPHLTQALSAVTHDLRSPLSSIMGYADLLDHVGTLTQEQRQFAQTIRQNAQRMNDMMGELLKLARLEQGGDVDTSAMAAFYNAGPLGDLKVSAQYFMPVLMDNAETRFMTYRVERPISVKRGQSAIVPIINVEIQFQRLCVYNGDKMPNHPLLVWELENTTGFALEQGPVTIVDNNQYLGEGLMRFSGVGDNIQIPYALEFGILVIEKTEWNEKETFRLTFDSEQRRVVLSKSQITNYIYTLDNRTDREITVLLERRDPNPSRGEYFEMPEAMAELAGHTRWAVNVPPKDEVNFQIRVRNTFDETEDVADWSAQFINELHDTALLSDAKHTLLVDLLLQKQNIQDASDQQNALRSEYERIGLLQDQLRKNLAALGSSEREAAIRNQVLNDLENSENRRREIEHLETEVQLQIKQSQQNQQALTDQIYP